MHIKNVEMFWYMKFLCDAQSKYTASQLSFTACKHTTMPTSWNICSPVWTRSASDSFLFSSANFLPAIQSRLTPALMLTLEIWRQGRGLWCWIYVIATTQWCWLLCMFVLYICTCSLPIMQCLYTSHLRVRHSWCRPSTTRGHQLKGDCAQWNTLIHRDSKKSRPYKNDTHCRALGYIWYFKTSDCGSTYIHPLHLIFAHHWTDCWAGDCDDMWLECKLLSWSNQEQVR